MIDLFRHLVPLVIEKANHFRERNRLQDRNRLPVFHEHGGQLLDIVLLFLQINVFNFMDVQSNSDDFFWFMMTDFLKLCSGNNDRFSR